MIPEKSSSSRNLMRAKNNNLRIERKFLSAKNGYKHTMIKDKDHDERGTRVSWTTWKTKR